MFDLATVRRRLRPSPGRVSGAGRDDSGVAAIEFALVAPLLIALVMAIIDIGMATYAKREAHAAAQAGAQFSLIAGWEPADIEAVAAGSSTLAAPLITVERVWACSQPTGLSFVAEGSSCGSGGAGTYVRVTVDPQFSSILPVHIVAVAPAVAIMRIK